LTDFCTISGVLFVGDVNLSAVVIHNPIVGCDVALLQRHRQR
jgi:hypothetical protein